MSEGDVVGRPSSPVWRVVVLLSLVALMVLCGGLYGLLGNYSTNAKAASAGVIAIAVGILGLIACAAWATKIKRNDK